MKVSLPYGRSHLEVVLPDHLRADLLEPPQVDPAPDPLALTHTALDLPQGQVLLSSFVGARSAAVAVNDKTRPVPVEYLLPPLLQRLEILGIPPQAVTLLVAVGLHAPTPPQDFHAVIPSQCLERYAAFSHDARDKAELVQLGKTSRRTPVWVNRRFYQADLRIVVGNIEPHQFAGFSGGVKTAAVGLGGADTIQHNHSLLRLPGARLGEYHTNPVRQDIEEIGRKIGVHFALNAVLNQDKRIVEVLAGEPRAVMRSGVPISRRVSQLRAAWPYDLLIVSPGGHPKDIDLYQAQKALAHASLLAKPGGTLLLAAACPEGAGSSSFETWMKGSKSLAEALQRFAREEFRIGPHKGYLIARDASRVDLRLYSSMPAEQVRALLLDPLGDLQGAVDEAVARLKPGARVGVLPHASSTIPFIDESGFVRG